MSLDDQIRWDRQYGQSDRSEKPSTFLKQILDEGHWDIAPGRALDIASGAGRNALFLAAKGFAVTAVDISQSDWTKGRGGLRSVRSRSLGSRQTWSIVGCRRDPMS